MRTDGDEGTYSRSHDERIADYTATCPDCGTVCAKTGMTHHRKSVGCKARAATREAMRQGLAPIADNERAFFAESGYEIFILDTRAGTRATALQPQPWVDRDAACLLRLTRGWRRKDRVIVLRLLRSAFGDRASAKSLALAARSGDAALAKTVFDAWRST